MDKGEIEILDLDEDVYKFLHRHIEKSLKDDELRYGKFNSGRNIVKEIVQNYLNGIENDLIKVSRELAKQLFKTMKSNCNIPSADLIIVSLTTDQGPMIAILKMDYVKNFTHEVKLIDKKIGVEIIPQAAGLPGSGQKIQKVAFVKPIRENETYNLMILDKQKSNKDEECGAKYFINSFLGATYVMNERDMTKDFMRASENWVRKTLSEDAVKAEEIRSNIKNKLKEEEILNFDELSEELFSKIPVEKDSFSREMKMQCAVEEIAIDKTYIDKKFKISICNFY